MTFEIEIGKDDDGVKPRNFLKKKLDVPYYRIPKLIKDKRITVNGKKIKDETVLRTGDVVKVWAKDVGLRGGINRAPRDSKDLGMETVFENKDFLVLNKLPGVIVQGAQDNSTSLSLHLEFLKQKGGDKTPFDYFHVHRLDKETSGILVCAKNKVSLRDLNKIFMQREIVKKYVCLCIGHFDEKEGQIEISMKRNPEGCREKMGACLPEDCDGKKSLSLFRVLEEFEHDGEDFSLVEVEIKTGLMHQIRVHMKYIGHPIVGDSMYGNSSVNRKFEGVLDRQFLHAKEIEFEYGKKFKFEAPLTDDLQKTMEMIR